jgi:hypothetical protein
MVFVEGEDYRQLRRPGDDPAAFRSVVRLNLVPDSVVHQYRGENFTTSTWTDSVGSADMSINGVSASTLNGARAASSDGVDDFGSANSPEDLPGQSDSFGVAFTVLSNDTTDNSTIFGARDNNGVLFQVTDSNAFDNSNGQPFLGLIDKLGNALLVESTQSITDNAAHLVVINKQADTGPGAAEIFIDDMEVDTAVIRTDGGFSSADYKNTEDMVFFARSLEGTTSDFKSLDTTFIEFKESPYSPLERQALKRRK